MNETSKKVRNKPAGKPGAGSLLPEFLQKKDPRFPAGGNLFDYAAWRGDLSFEEAPFNEVDNLVLSYLAYVDFEGVLTQRSFAADDAGESGAIDEGMTLKEACTKYFTLHTEEEVLDRNTFFKLASLLLKPLAASARYQDVTLHHYVNEVDVEADKQMAAVTFDLGVEGLYAAFRGTDNTIVGWKEDCQLAFRTETAGQQRAVDYLNRRVAPLYEQIRDRADQGEAAQPLPVSPHENSPGMSTNSSSMPKLRVGGHSKGGNLAVYAAAFCDADLQERISTIYSNDGPGFLRAVTETAGYQAILPRVISIVPECSIIGTILSSDYQTVVVKSEERLLMQHDALSWVILGDRFVRADETSEVSRWADQTVEEWLANLDLDQRQMFFDSLFSLFEAGDAETLEEMSANKLATMGTMLKAMGELPKETRKAFGNMAVDLLKTGGSLWADTLRARSEEG